MRNRRHTINIGKVLLVGLLVLVMAGCAAKSVSEKEIEEAPPESLTISGINTSQTDDGMRVSIKADGELTYTAVKQRDPLGVILYLPLTKLADTGKIAIPDNHIIDSVIPSMTANQKTARIEIGLLKDCPYKVEKDSSMLNVFFASTQAAGQPPCEAGSAVVSQELGASKTMDDKEKVEHPGEMKDVRTRESATVTEKEKPADRPTTAAEPAIVKRIDFSAKESGKSAIIIETSRPVEYQIKRTAPQVLKIHLYASRLPDYHHGRPLITTRFDSAVDRITPVQAADKENITNILVELREQVPYRPVQSKDLLTIHFEPSTIGPRPFEAASLPPWQKVLEDSMAPTEALPGEESSEIEAGKAEDPYAALLGEDKVYTGQKIALDFFETNIKNVFRILQQVSGKNFAIDPNVSGTVTLSFQKPVPWDQVLDLVLQMNSLDKVEKGEIVRIATKETLKAEEDAKRARITAIQARKEQQKQLEPMVTEYLSINYANAQNEVLPHVKDVLSKERGNITVDQRNNQLIITDTKGNIGKAKEIIAKIDRVTPQVIIECRIVEANDNFDRKVGVSWSAGGEDIYKSELGGNYSYNSVINTPFIGGGEAADSITNPSTFNFSFERLPSMGTPFVLDATLRAMETDQVLRIISTPKIVTLDNKEATITQGIEWPYQNVEDDDVETEFKEIELTLKVTPHITPDDRVSLEINLKKDDIYEITAEGEPALSTNEALTELLIDDGQTIVIGGIVKRTENNAESGVPILKDVPGVGFLFRANQDEVTKRELLIFMTPTIVQLEQRGLLQAENE